LRRLLSKLRNFFHPRRAEGEMTREIASHLALLEDEFLRRGMDLPEARLAARRAYGGIEQAKELHRDARSLAWLEQLLQDVRHAWRSLRKSPGFIAVALLSLAFGIGVNSAIFTLVNGILLKTLLVPDPHRIVQINERAGHHAGDDRLGFQVFRGLRRQSEIFTDAIAFSNAFVPLDTGGEPSKIDLGLVSGSYFSFFGARPVLGRLLDDEDDRVESAHRVCVLSYQTWQTHFAGDLAVINRAVRINDVPVQVVGIAAPDFVGAELQRRYDAWSPTALANEITRQPREDTGMGVLARLKPGLSLAEARLRLASVTRSIEEELLKNRRNEVVAYEMMDAGKGFDSWRTGLRDPLTILMGAVLLVLLVACANLTNLLLARANERHQEFAIKLSLGISRWRLLRQLLVETFLLAISGGVIAYFLSSQLLRILLVWFNAGQRDDRLAVVSDTPVVLFTFALAVFTTLAAGLYPAWQACRTDSSPGLKGAALHGVRRGMMRRSLILVQVTLAVVLLFGATLLTHSFRNLKTANLGYDIDHVLTVQTEQRSLYDAPAARSPLPDVLTRVRQLPAVESAALSAPGVLSEGVMVGNVRSKGNHEAHQEGYAAFLKVSPGYFATMRTPLLRGRDFTNADRKGAPPVAIVNQRFATKFFPGQNPVGEHFDFGGDVEIIGVVADSIYFDIREQRRATMYFPFDQSAQRFGALEIRCRGSLSQVEREVRQIIQSEAPSLQVSNASAMEVVRDNLIAQDRVLTFLSTLLGALGTTLALVGIYGLISYSVTRRTREIGIRVSVGARRSDVLWLFLRESTLLVAGGILIGLPLALALARLLRKALFEVSPSDPIGIVATLVLFLLGGLLASFVPAHKATRVNPIQALRYD
jgi:predicted permease